MGLFCKKSQVYLLKAFRQRVRDRRWQDLGQVHLLEHLDGKVLEATDVDGAFFAGLEVAASNAEVGGWANLTFVVKRHWLCLDAREDHTDIFALNSRSYCTSVCAKRALRLLSLLNTAWEATKRVGKAGSVQMNFVTFTQLFPTTLRTL